jgi:FkbM family methyltransferase
MGERPTSWTGHVALYNLHMRSLAVTIVALFTCERAECAPDLAWMRTDRDAPDWCPHLPGQIEGLRYVRRDALDFCDALVKAHKQGMPTSSLMVDVGTAEWAAEALIARGFGHPVITFECRGHVAYQLGQKLRFYNDSGLRLVHSCVSDHNGLGLLLRAMDSSSMIQSAVEDPGARWKARRERREGPSSEAVAVVSLDSALESRSLAALGWPALVGSKVGFIKVDVQGLEEPVLRGGIITLLSHAPFLFYEDSMLPTADQKGALIARLLREGRRKGLAPPSGKLRYICECKNDCFCSPRSGHP